MNADERSDLVRKGLMAAWAAATVVLLVCVTILAWEIGQRHEAPAVVSAELAASAAEQPQIATEVPLYFADPDGFHLSAEPRRVELTNSTPENCRRVLNALIEGPLAQNTPILPANTRLRGVYLLEQGELVVDFSRELELGHPKSALADGLFVYGVVATLTQQTLQRPDSGVVRRVRFLLEGSPPRESFPAHVDISQPVYPDSAWLAASRDAAQNG